jgi:hypothetical protein
MIVPVLEGDDGAQRAEDGRGGVGSRHGLG